jgi:hypothetical protein
LFFILRSVARTSADGYASSDAVTCFFQPNPAASGPDLWSTARRLSGHPRATGTQPLPQTQRAMPNNRQFDAACAALRQKLRDLVYTEGVPSTNADGSFVLDDEGDIVVEELRPSAAAAARASSLARSVRKSAARVTGLHGAFSGKHKASSLGRDALRVVVQHTCQADREVLSARPDCPEHCYVVTCETDLSCDEKHSKDIYAPALTSWNLAWNLCRKRANRTWESQSYPEDWEVEYAGREIIVREDSEDSYTFGVCGYPIQGTLEDVESFLDLRTLAAARVVVGLDTLSGQMLNAVVKLRETKMPRTLYFEDPGDCWDDCFEFTDLRVYKSAAGFDVDNFEFQVYPAEVLKSAAELAVHWPKPRVGDIISWDYTLTPAAPDLHQFMKMVRGQKNDTIASYRELRDVAGEEVCVDVAIRPLALAAEANRVVRWDKGVRTFVKDAIARFPKFPITIKPLGGEDVVVRVRGPLTIYQVKGMLEDSLPWAPVCPASQLKLLFKNRSLDDDRTVACYDIQKDSTLHVRLNY